MECSGILLKAVFPSFRVSCIIEVSSLQKGVAHFSLTEIVDDGSSDWGEQVGTLSARRKLNYDITQKKKKKKKKGLDLLNSEDASLKSKPLMWTKLPAFSELLIFVSKMGLIVSLRVLLGNK